MCLKSTENNTLLFWAKDIRFKIRIFRHTCHKPNMGFDTDMENITKGGCIPYFHRIKYATNGIRTTKLKQALQHQKSNNKDTYDIYNPFPNLKLGNPNLSIFMSSTITLDKSNGNNDCLCSRCKNALEVFIFLTYLVILSIFNFS